MYVKSLLLRVSLVALWVMLDTGVCDEIQQSTFADVLELQIDLLEDNNNNTHSNLTVYRGGFFRDRHPAEGSDLDEACNKTHPCRQHYSECVSVVMVFRCQCKTNFRLVVDRYRKRCVPEGQEIYKVVMIALACFMFTFLSIFIMFMCYRSRQNNRLCRRDREDGGGSTDDIFSICDQLAQDQLAAVSKPPTYEDVATADRKMVGTPPPPYSEEYQAIATARFTSSSNGHDNSAFVQDEPFASCSNSTAENHERAVT